MLIFGGKGSCNPSLVMCDTCPLKVFCPSWRLWSWKICAAPSGESRFWKTTRKGCFKRFADRSVTDSVLFCIFWLQQWKVISMPCEYKYVYIYMIHCDIDVSCICARAVAPYQQGSFAKKLNVLSVKYRKHQNPVGWSLQGCLITGPKSGIVRMITGIHEEITW